MLKKLLLGFICFFVSICLQASVLDSTGTEKRDGKIYVVHEVEAKETLFALSRRYNVSVDDIKKENPEVLSGLQIGQVVKIPVGVYEENNRADGKIQHEVKPKETLYGISKTYNVTIDQIKALNPEVADGLKIGQTLYIPGKETGVIKVAEDKKETVKAEVKMEIKEEPKPKPEPVEIEKVVVHAPVLSTPVIHKSGEKVVENGIAELIEDDLETAKYLALHKSAPVGTVVQVTNEANGQMIFVRVIGKLPDMGTNDKVIIKISKKAFEKISPTDKRARVNLAYIP